ncbi:MAG TPA: YARHG domain-containing protein [Ignavibacteria bacterium]|nr:YARHG domain-containing protein [Ignavibacteria bacterium]
MKKLLIFCISVFLILSVKVHANDGVFYTRGNQLIPMFESEISLKKEILDIERIGQYKFKVTVQYELNNPGTDKTLDVGFEAMSPSGDADGTPVNGAHPYIFDFSVNMNGEKLPFEVAIVSDSLYYVNGKFISKTAAQVITEIDNPNEVNFNYVYHFKAPFKKGINRIIHTYIFNSASSTDSHYNLEYVLTAANRWANRQIDDFTLNLNLGEFSDVVINSSFYDNPSDWKFKGNGKYVNIGEDYLGNLGKDNFRFYSQTGFITFKKQNFKPEGELFIYAPPFYSPDYSDEFNYYSAYLPYSIEFYDRITGASDIESLEVLKNFPYALRGVEFEDKISKEFFSSLVWYMPEKNLNKKDVKLTAIEIEWLSSLKVKKQ